MTVSEIKAPILSELNQFESKFLQSMESEIPLLNKIMHYIVKRKGKQMRPIFVFLSAKMFGKINDETFTSASLIELLHTATLVHDDVIDDANERRGFFSINALWKNKVAVLVGDYLLSKVLLLSIEQKNYQSLEIVAQAVREMSEGELLQIEKARKLDITEEIYFEVIRKKTASLISSCCQIGVVSVGENSERERMKRFGELIGLAFQIKDDIFDYGLPSKIGKPTGNDIREQKITLPLIYVLNNSNLETKKELINIIKRHHTNNQKIKRAIELVIKSGGIEYAYKKMIELKDQALLLINDTPDSDAKKSLIGLVNYTVNREK